MHEKHQKAQKFRGLGEPEKEEMTRAQKSTKSIKKYGFCRGGRGRERGKHRELLKLYSD